MTVFIVNPFFVTPAKAGVRKFLEVPYYLNI